MRILKKVLWIWIFVLAFSLFNCSLINDCNCLKPVTKLSFFALDNETSSYNLVRRGSNTYLKEDNDTTIFFKFNYWGFGVNYSTQATAQNSNYKSKPTNFSFIPSAHACECIGNRIDYQIKNVYPISFKVYNLYPVNDSTRETRLVNDLLFIRNENLKMAEDNIRIDTSSLLSEQQNLYDDTFEVQFLLNYNLIDSDSLKFRIETELNTGEILITETPSVVFEY